VTALVNQVVNVRVQFWDTAGQERYHAITKSYFRGSDGCILVYDCTDRKSYENIKRWNEHLYENADEVLKQFPRILVGNKCDTTQDFRRVTETEGTQLAQNMSSKLGNIEFIECSAKTGEKVDEMFQTIVRNAVLNMTHRKSTLKK
jgi:small GTP-binding protein